MITLVFFLEELSAKALLEILLPRFIPEDKFVFRFVPFEGKQDLEKQLVRRIRGWRTPNTHFVVLRDQDSAECKDVKQRLLELCAEAGRPDTMVRVACRELESWYLGDLKAVEKAFCIKNLASKQKQKKYRNPDALGNPIQELERITNKKYQKVSGSRAIGLLLDIHNNRSPSFQVFVSGVKQLTGSES
jgi:hypothetical protein